jgi:hypothetical protein
MMKVKNFTNFAQARANFSHLIAYRKIRKEDFKEGMALFLAADLVRVRLEKMDQGKILELVGPIQ